MPSLRETQFAVADAVIHVAGSGGAIPLVRGGRLPAQARLAVYRNNHHETLMQALAATYPVVERLVGGDFFRQAARRHVVGFPSRTGNLIDYGDGFASYLERLPQAQGLPYLADVARLEWALHAVFHAPADPSFSLDDLPQLPAECLPQLTLRSNAAASWVDSSYPLFAIWQANQPGAADDLVVDLEAGGDRLLVIQRDHAAQVVELAPGELAWLDALDRGETLQHATDRAGETEADFDLASVLLRHLRLGTFVRPSLLLAEPAP
ncbi:MAG TPA: DNA-binding domain-containing protein [Nevskiaceae bacterium]|nr:DNA-binding domain-containing protein [Nevskiaceae bacterium]